MRKGLHDDILRTVLYHRDNNGISKEDFPKAIENEFEFSEFPKVLVKDSLERLLNKEHVRKDKNGRFHLTSEKYSEIESLLEERKENLEELRLKLIEDIRSKNDKEISEEDEKLILDTLHGFLAFWFGEKSDFVKEVLIGEKYSREVESSIPKETLKKIANENIENKSLRRNFEKSTLEVLSEIDEKTGKSLYSIVRNYLYAELLAVDPECSFFVDEAFSKTALFLDTNVVLALLLPSHWSHDFIQEIISLALSLGVKITFTKKTKKEYLDFLKGSKNMYNSLSEKARSKIKNEVENSLINSFYLKKESNPSLSFRGYYSTMRQLEDRLSGYNILPCDELDIDIESISIDDEVLNDTTLFVETCARERRDNIKRMEVAEHDAYHLQMVRELRDDDTCILGSRFWFLTLDSSLRCVDEKIKSDSGELDSCPASIMAEDWLELITPFLSPTIEEGEMPKAFSSLMRSQFATLPSKIKLDELIDIQGDWLNYDELSTEDIKNILGDSVVQSHLSDLKSARRSYKPEKVEKYKQKAKDRADEKAKDIALEKRLEPIKRFWETISGVLGAVFILVSLVLILMKNILAGSIVLGGGIVLLILAIAPDRMRAKIPVIGGR